MITYQQYPNGLAAWGIGVFLNRKLTGYIERTLHGDTYKYYYSPCNSHIVGDEFDSIAEVKASIEGRDE